MKNSILFTLVLFITLFSCNNDSSFVEVDQLTSKDIETLHNEVEKNVSIYDSANYLNNNIDFQTESVVAEGYDTVQLFNTFLVDWDFVQNNSLEELYVNASLNPEIVEAAQYYLDNIANSVNIYEDLIGNFESLSEDDFEKVFYIVAIANYLEYLHGMNGEIQLKSWGCAISVAATILHTLSAVTITTPVGLGFWLAGKALATAGVIGSCG